MEHITSLDQLTADLVLFTGLSMRGEAVTEVKNRILAIETRSPLTVNASKILGVKEFSSPKEVAEALDAKMKELGVDKMNSAQMNSPEIKSQIEKLKLAAATLNTQLNFRDAKRAIEQEVNNGKAMEAKLDVIAKKLATGQELTVQEVLDIGKFSDTPIVDGSQGYNFRSPVEAMNVVMASKLNIPRGSEKFNVLQGHLGKYSEFANKARQQFKGESKQIQTKKKLYIGKALDANKIKNEIAQLAETTEANQDLSVINDPIIKENLQRLKQVQQEMIDLVNEGREVEKTEYQADIDFVSRTAEELNIGFEEMNAAAFDKLAKDKWF